VLIKQSEYSFSGDGTTEGFKIDPASLGMNCSDYRELEPEHDRKSEAEGCWWRMSFPPGMHPV